MSRQPIDLTGGQSVYCFNQNQITAARELAFANPQTAPAIQAALARLEEELDRNQRAALAFVLIDRLQQTSAA